MPALVGLILIAAGLGVIGIYSLRIYRSKPWLPYYVKWKGLNVIKSRKFPSPRHIMFLFVDHFEPWEDTNDMSIAASRMEKWIRNYPAMASKHQDADGVVPQHTWFYLIENWQWKEYDAEFLRGLGSLSFDGFGEVELHLHHGSPQRIFPDVDTPEKLQTLIEEMKDFFSQTGALITTGPNPSQLYGFIHGKWALANSMNGLFCGVDNELEVLSATGCYADFTMPSGIESQAKKINGIYYPKGDLKQAKAFDFGEDVRVGGRNNGALMVFPGMIDIYFRNVFLRKPIVEKSNIDWNEVPTKLRIDQWIKCNIHVKNRPEWIFVKVHTHGAREENFDVSFGEQADWMYSYLEEKYNDGERFKLHYVTAREAYNIVKAAEAGEDGDPTLFRDYLIQPYANRRIRSNVPYRLLSYFEDKIKIRVDVADNKTKFEFKGVSLKCVEGGSIEFLEYSSVKDASLIRVSLHGRGTVHLIVIIPRAAIKVRNANLIKKEKDLNGIHYHLETKLRSNMIANVEIRY